MKHSIQPLTDALKSAREKKGLSQRAFGRAIGVPQSRLSKIESGAVDLRTSNLVEIARTLDLEVMLVPRQFVPAVNSLVKQTAETNGGYEAQRPLYQLNEEDDDA
ncbi:MAG: helix-turn-helix transcriptional regulator [Gammaproteobacteria bacterium]|nr:helix-turn-helix transcriptional regulator [Gammaproteobacteria bacterium]